MRPYEAMRMINEIDSTKIIKQLQEIAQGFESIVAQELQSKTCNCYHECPHYHSKLINEAWSRLRNYDFPMKFSSFEYNFRSGLLIVRFNVKDFGEQQFILGNFVMTQPRLQMFFDHINQGFYRRDDFWQQATDEQKFVKWLEGVFE